MLMRLARQTYVRQYGEFTYLFGKVSSFDQVFRSAGPFFAHITRQPKKRDAIIDEIMHDYADVSREIVEKDFDELFSPLIAQKVILIGKNAKELDSQEQFFTYDCDNPKTKKDTHVYTRDEIAALPATLMERYFAEHPTLFSLHVDVTQACTERCRHCYVPEYNPIFLPYDKICQVLDDFREMGGIHVSLSGGECMMHKDIIKIIKAIRERDCTVGCLSNLTVCTDEIINALVEADGTVQASLYSMSPAIHDEVTRRKGSWIETVGAIMRLRAAQIPVLISCPCLRINYKGYTEVMKFADSLKMDAQTDFIIMGKQDCDTSNLCNRLHLDETRELLQDVILKAVPMNSEYFSPGKKEQMLSAAEWRKQKVCGACVNSMCLNATGDYYPCPGFAGVVLGNCYKDSLHDVWINSEETKRIRAVTGADFGKCAECKDRDYCSVCMCRNFNETGDMLKPAEHFCKVAAINHEVVDEKQRQMIEMAKCNAL
ncbi:MAG: radical SAM protein [Kiritimatiellae bacterium]|nr:radical SAM protein [Kiritimatiellia bacterium]